MIKGLLKSRKFWLTFSAAAAVILNDRYGMIISQEAILTAAMSIVALVCSIAYEDRGAKEAGKSPKDIDTPEK